LIKIAEKDIQNGDFEPSEKVFSDLKIERLIKYLCPNIYNFYPFRFRLPANGRLKKPTDMVYCSRIRGQQYE
jgi:hypothetical protein